MSLSAKNSLSRCPDASFESRSVRATNTGDHGSRMRYRFLLPSRTQMVLMASVTFELDHVAPPRYLMMRLHRSGEYPRPLPINHLPVHGELLTSGFGGDVV